MEKIRYIGQRRKKYNLRSKAALPGLKGE